jgi:hypothetical protein
VDRFLLSNGSGRSLFMRIAFIPVVVAIILSLSNPSNASFIFDFSTAVETQVGGYGPPPPAVGAFPSIPGFGSVLFEVGNLTNGCGLYPTASIPSRVGVGTTCVSGQTLAQEIDYSTAADRFTLATDTEAVLQLFIKVGHPESTNPSQTNQQQVEQFDIFLENGGGPVGLAQLLDTVTGTAIGVQNGYYLYTYRPAIVDAGEWFPSFRAQDGSIEFLARLSAATPAAEPASTALMGLGLFAASLLSRRLTRVR